MRWAVILHLTFLMACQSDGTSITSSSSLMGTGICERGMTAYEYEVQDAVDTAPPCDTDSDWVRFSLDFSYCSVFKYSGCGEVLHRASAATLNSKEVKDRICKAAGNGPEGCSIDVICVRGGTPTCQDGECVEK